MWWWCNHYRRSWNDDRMDWNWQWCRNWMMDWRWWRSWMMNNIVIDFTYKNRFRMLRLSSLMRDNFYFESWFLNVTHTTNHATNSRLNATNYRFNMRFQQC